MTIKEMLKKVEAYNEVSSHLNYNRAVLCFKDGDGHTFVRAEIEDYRTFTNFLRRTYVPEVVETIKTWNGYKFDEPYTVDLNDPFGGRITGTFIFYLITK